MSGKAWNGRRLARRDFLKVGGAAVLVTASAGCDFLSTDPAQEGGQGNGAQNGPGGAAAKGKEAPMLAEMVERGELPPVEERLPGNPVVLEPVERMGVYGGEWATGLLGTADIFYLVRTVGYETLARWDTGWNEIVPNVAESFEANEDGTEYTFTLREGLKWSDGEPFTADDVVFAYNDVVLNESLSLVPLENPAEVERLGEYEVRFTFERPEGLFLQNVAAGNQSNGYGGDILTGFPRHYFERFHEKYNPDVQRLVEEEGVGDWVELFQGKGGLGYQDVSYWGNKDLPRLFAWQVVTPLGEGTRVVVERNPYYWKVDPEGSQLPYIDRVVFDVVEDAEPLTVRTLNGGIGMIDRNVNTLQNKPTLARSRQKGKYHFFDLTPSEMNEMILSLNLNHKDRTKREIFNNRDFRIGLSHAMDRQEIIDVIYQSQGEPWQASPRPESEALGLTNERLAKQYTEYDVNLANEFLDRAGYSETDDEGVRLGPDGEPISFAVEVRSETPEWVDALGLIQRYWREVGVDMNVKSESRDLFSVRVAEEGAHDAAVWSGDGGLKNDVLLLPSWYMPVGAVPYYANLWAEWYASKGEAGEEPPEAARRQMDLYDRLQRELDSGEQAALMQQILEIAAEEFWVMGISLKAQTYGVVKNNFHNVPEKTFFGTYSYLNPAPTNPSQFFIQG